MVEVKWTLQASQDLESIAEFISKDSEQRARLFVADIFQAVDRIAGFPESGRVVPEIGDAMIREILLGNFRLVYRIKRSTIDLLTIYHGARLLDPSKHSR
jgi:toxin ParE1/3/4